MAAWRERFCNSYIDIRHIAILCSPSKQSMISPMNRETDKSKPLKRQIEDVCARYGIEILYAFGSRSQEVKALVEGKVANLDDIPSDVDIGLKRRPGGSLTVREKAQLAVELEDILDVDRVDLCDIRTCDPFVAANIVRGETLFCQDQYRADEYELYVLRRAGDLSYLERKRIALIMGQT